jgi:hypothetical protein
VIKCTSCGKLTYEGIGNCQHCGALLPGKVGGGVDPRMGAPELPELPSWLESLRANELPGTATGPQLNYSTDDFIDKDALPSWMHPESAEYISADQTLLRQAAATPASNTGGPAFTSGISANSLIDEQALPSWMQEGQSASPQRNIAASSLVQPDALPEWMRDAQQQPATAAPGADRPAAASAPQGLSGNSLIDSQAIPAWMSEQNQGGPGTSPEGQAGLTGNSLIDMNALPNWMREGGQEQRPAWPEEHTPVQFGQPPNTNALTAPSLIDVNALPEWLHAGTGQGQAGIAASPSPAPVPPRVESVRVPSRPRMDMGPREQSQVAANVFASMLGVASPTPYFQSQAPNVMNAASPPPGQPRPQMGSSLLGAGGPGSMTGQSPVQGNYMAGNAANQQPGSPPYPQANPAAMAPNGQTNPRAKSTKRGFFANFLSWFSR